MQHHFSRILFFCLCFFCVIPVSFANQQLIIEPDMGRAPILNAIQHAKSSIDLVMYGLTDLQFVDALTDAKAKNKNVKVLLQQHPYKADDENKIAITHLQAAQINLHWPDTKFKLTHQKTFLIDDNTAFIMTFNLTHSSFSKERNFALIVTDPSNVQEIKAVFDADWQHSDVSVHQPDLLWSPDNSRDKLIALIQQARTDIKIYAEGLSDYQLVGILAKAARTGIHVTVLTSAFNDKPASKSFQYLAKNGVKILYSKDYVIHAKVIIIDQTEALLGSINMTRQSIDSNRELAIITHDPKIIHELTQTFDSDIQHATTAVTVHAMKAASTYVLLKSVKQLITVVNKYHRNTFKRKYHHHKHQRRYYSS
jgi:cardiolipin synthase